MKKFRNVEPTPELAPDLEWMLQSGQVSLPYLMEHLAGTYQAPVYRLALSLLDSQEAAELAVQRTFQAVVANLHVYRGETGAERWLYRLAWREIVRLERSERRWRQVESWLRLPGQFTGKPVAAAAGPDADQLLARTSALPAVERHALLLTLAPEWGADRAASLLETSTEKVEQAARRGLSKIAAGGSGQSVESAETELAALLQARWEAGASLPDASPQLSQRIQAQTGRLRLFRRGFATVKELVFLLLALVFIGALVWGGNRFLLAPEPLPTPETRLPGIGGAQPGQNRAAEFPGRIATSSPRRTPTPDFTPTPTPEGVYYQVGPADSLRSLAESFGVSPDELRSLNRLAPEDRLERWERIIIPGALKLQIPEATPVTPVPKREPLPPPTTSDQVRKLLQLISQPVNTMWIDALLVTYPDQNGQGLPRLNRLQAWLSENQYLLIAGAADGDPQEVLLNTGHGVYIAHPGDGIPWFERLSSRSFDPPIDVTYMFGLSMLFNESERLQGAEFKLLGEGQAAGREAWVVSQVSDLGDRRSILWLDQQTGLILRHRRFNEETVLEAFDSPLPMDVIVMKLALDVNFPQDLFDTDMPWRGGFARDYDGLAESQDEVFPAWEAPGITSDGEGSGGGAAPDSILSFRFPPASGILDPQQETLIYAGGQRVASLDLGEPWNLWCSRSTDGDLIVFAPSSADPETVLVDGLGPRYFRLSDPGNLYQPMATASLVSSYFAVSPDGQQIAWWACAQARQECGVYVHDTRTQINRKVIALSQGATYFAWSPSGEELAMLGANDSFFVVRVQDGQLTYKGPFDRFMGAIPPDSPTYTWGIDYPPRLGGLEACLAPALEQPNRSSQSATQK